jgi:SAM-dependent methyltransferase
VNDPHEESFAANRRMWDERVGIHLRTEFYDVENFLAGENTLLPIEREELGDVSGKSLLHLQCHFGMDTLSLARMGARVTGVDFSGEAVRAARELAERAGIEARFVESNVYDLPGHLQGEFDVVFTSYGALCWLPDLARWGELVARYLKPGGTFYVADVHPFLSTLDDDSTPDHIRVRHPYFKTSRPLVFNFAGSYAEGDAKTVHNESHEWPYSLHEVVEALRVPGLRVEFVHEFPLCCFARFPWLVKGDSRWWRLPDGIPEFPMTFSLKAFKPAEVSP